MLKILIFVSDAQLFLMLRHVLGREGFEAVLITEPDEVGAVPDPGKILAMIVGQGAPEHCVDEAFNHARVHFPSAAVIHLLRKTSGREIPTDQCDLRLESPLDPGLLLGFLRRLSNRFREMEWEDAGTVLSFADLSMNLAEVKVKRAGREIQLTALEFRLLRRLLQNPCSVCDRDVLIRDCWPKTTEVEPRTVDIHIGHIRRALAGSGPDLIRTIRGRGYALELPD